MTTQTQTTQTSNMQDAYDNDSMLHGEQHQQEQQDISAGDVVRQAQLTPRLHAGAEVLQQQAAEIVMQVCHMYVGMLTRIPYVHSQQDNSHRLLSALLGCFDGVPSRSGRNWQLRGSSPATNLQLLV